MLKFMISTSFLVLPIGIAAFGATYGGGSGTMEDPYQIWTPTQMHQIGLHEEDWDKHFILMSDVDMSEYDGLEGRPTYNPIGRNDYLGDRIPFSGVFNGNGKKVINLRLSSESAASLGLFGYVQGGECVIKDLGIVEPVIKSGSGSYVGALVGYCSFGEIRSCYTQGGKVEGENCVGGLIGLGGTVYQSYTTSDVTGVYYVGGLIGHNSADVHECYAKGQVVGVSAVGGLIGSVSDSSISHCYAIGDVEGQERVGGLFGDCKYDENQPWIEYCYACGSVSGSTWTGGIGGKSHQSIFLACYWDIETSGQSGGIGTADGSILEVQDLYGKNTMEMYSGATYRGWGSCGIWSIDEGKDYPQLLWQGMPGTVLDDNFFAGQGTQADPYLIDSVEDLVVLGDFPCLNNKHFRLVNDIDLGGIENGELQLIGRDPIPFTGVFDGDGHVILNLVLPTGGLFECVGCEGIIKNLGLINVVTTCCTLVRIVEEGGLVENCWVENAIINGSGSVGGLIVENRGRILECRFQGSVLGDGGVGGIVGRNSLGDYYSGPTLPSVERCYADAVIEGRGQQVGGLVGYNRGRIMECRSRGIVFGTTSVGGLVGRNYGYTDGRVPQIERCLSTADVTGVGDAVGGLVGACTDNTRIIDCYAMGSVKTERSAAGGLVGATQGLIVNCYSTGDVTGEFVGGLVGRDDSTSPNPAFASYWDVNTSGIIESAAGEGRTSADMMRADTFVQWGYEGAWTIDEEADYPHLAWENRPGEVITVGKRWEGSGREEDPFLICTSEELDSIGFCYQDLDKHFRLCNDIDAVELGQRDSSLIAQYPKIAFRGIFDGADHTISNISIVCSSSTLGLFGYVGLGGKVRNVVLKNVSITSNGGNMVGAIVGRIESGGKLVNCRIEGGMITGLHYVGGITGRGGDLDNCYAKCTVLGDMYIGGLVGQGGEIFNSFFEGTVIGQTFVGGLIGRSTGDVANCAAKSEVSGGTRVGGLVGAIGYTDVTNCRSEGSVTGRVYVGGLVGEAFDNSIIKRSWSRSFVTGLEYGTRIGGLLGENNSESSLICDCYSTGAIYCGSDTWRVGCLVGSNTGTIRRCFSSMRVLGGRVPPGDGSFDIGGVVGFGSGTVESSFWDNDMSGVDVDDATQAKTTHEMQSSDTFVAEGWDFVGEVDNRTEDVWKICEGTNYPRLAWEETVGDFECPDGLGMEDLVVFALGWLSSSKEANWDERYNLDTINGERIDFYDFFVLAMNWILVDNMGPDLSLHYMFEEGNGMVAGDSSQFKIDSKLERMGTDAWIEGKFGGGLMFDGLDDRVRVCGWQGIGGGRPRTCCAWVKTTDTTEAIISWGTGETGAKWNLGTESSGRLQLDVGDGAIVGSTVICNDTWHHIAVVLEDDGTPNVNEIQLYVDGMLEIPSSVDNRVIHTVIGGAESLNVMIGAWVPGGAYFQGLIDEVRIYDRALSEEEVRAVAESIPIDTP